jgi:hypothetical protein
MRFITKKVRLIEMTTEEIVAFADLLAKAERGQTVHAAETQLADGSFLAVARVSDSSLPPRGAKAPIDSYPKAY